MDTFTWQAFFAACQCHAAWPMHNAYVPCMNNGKSKEEKNSIRETGLRACMHACIQHVLAALGNHQLLSMNCHHRRMCCIYLIQLHNLCHSVTTPTTRLKSGAAVEYASMQPTSQQGLNKQAAEAEHCIILLPQLTSKPHPHSVLLDRS